MKGTIADLRAMTVSDPDAMLGVPADRQPDDYDFYLAGPRELTALEARRIPVGNGQCAVLPQVVTNAPLTRNWRRGPRVKANKAMAKGTVIAVFDPDGRYSDGTYPQHAAIYLGQTKDGIQVLDQWHGRDVSSGFRRTLVFGSRKGAVNNGDCFHVVLTKKLGYEGHDLPLPGI